MQLLAVMVLMDLGIVNGSTRILNRVALKNAKFESVVLIRSHGYVFLISLLVSSLSYFLLTAVFSRNANTLLLIIAIYFATQFYRLMSASLIAHDRIYITQIIEIFVILLRLTIFFILFLYGYLSISSAIIVLLFTASLQLLLAYISTLKTTKLHFGIRYKASIRNLILYYSKHSFFISISNYGTSTLFPLLIWFIGNENLHIVFSLAVLIATGLSSFPSIIGTVFAPVSARVGVHKIKKYGRNYTNIVRANLAFACILYAMSVLGILIGGQTNTIQILTVLSHEENLYIASFVLLGLVTNVVNNNLRSFIVNRFDPSRVSYSDIGIFVCSLVLSVLGYLIIKRGEIFIFFWLLGGLLRAGRSWIIFTQLVSGDNSKSKNLEGMCYLAAFCFFVIWLIASYGKH